jgi:hypothetical protein
MADDAADRIKTIRSQIDSATQAKVRADMERDAAVATQTSMRQRLKDEFGVETSEDAQRVLTELDAELETRLSVVEAALGKARSDN